MATIQRAAHATAGRVYWAVFTRSPGFPIVHGSHWGARLDCGLECTGGHGHVFGTEAGARARLAILPTHYDSNYPGQLGREIGWQLGRVLYNGSSSFYDVVATAADALKAGDTVNTAGADATRPYWQRIASIDYVRRVGGRPCSGHGADVYSVTWEGSEENSAPSLFSSRRAYDVVTLRY